MLPSNPSINQALIRQPEVCKAISQTRSGLEKLRKKDPTFPKPVRFGDTRQSAVYYVIEEVNAWLQTKIEARDKA